MFHVPFAEIALAESMSSEDAEALLACGEAEADEGGFVILEGIVDPSLT